MKKIGSIIIIINYRDLSQEEYLMRTNNYLERFHCLLNQSLERIHPKISYLIYKYGDMSKIFIQR